MLLGGFRANTDLPPIVFCNEPLLGSKYDGFFLRSAQVSEMFSHVSLENPRILPMHDLFYRVRWNYAFFADHAVDEVASGNVKRWVPNV
jgi:hypothetical protein